MKKQRKRVSKLNQQPAYSAASSNHSIRTLYFREVLSHLLIIEKFIDRAEKHPENSQGLDHIEEATQAIIDLAMIHGFEGMERIAGKLNSVIGYLKKGRLQLSPSILTKMRLAVTAMRQVAGMEAQIERHMTVERVDRRVELNQKKIEKCAEKVTTSFDLLFKKQMEFPFEDNLEDASQLLFDISEPRGLMTLVDDREEPLNAMSVSPDLSDDANDNM